MKHVRIRLPTLAVLRFGFLAVAWGSLWGALAADAFAAGADPWPTLDASKLERGPGFYLSTWKIALAWLLFLAWVRTTDWVSRDCHERRLNAAVWNSAVVFSFVLAMILLWVVPSFWIGFPVLLAAYAIPLLLYIGKRNPLVMDDEKVLTGRHFRAMLAGSLSPVGVKVRVDAADPREEGPPVTITAGGLGDERLERANLLRARQSSGFPPVRRLIGEALVYRADAVCVDLLPQRTEIRFQVDGVWHPFEPEDVPTGAAMMDVVKLVSGLNVEEHATRQRGRFSAEFRGAPYACEVITEMSKTGERAAVSFANPRKRFETLAELGMREKAQQALKEALAGKQGLVLFSAAPKQGMTTTMDVALGTADRLMREVYAIEPANRREADIENITVVTFDPEQKQTAATIIPSLLRKYPDMIVARDWSDGPSATQLSQLAADDKLIVGSIAAREGAEALLRVLQLGVPPAVLAKAITSTVNQRLLRRLCDACKEPYQPTAEELKPFGLPADRVKQLYRTPRPDPTKKKKDQAPCAQCSGIGYFGRIAAFEYLPATDEIRKIIAEQPKMELLRGAARKAKARTLLEEAVVLAVGGTTSLDEVMRVFSAKG